MVSFWFERPICPKSPAFFYVKKGKRKAMVFDMLQEFLFGLLWKGCPQQNRANHGDRRPPSWS